MVMDGQILRTVSTTTKPSGEIVTETVLVTILEAQILIPVPAKQEIQPKVGYLDALMPMVMAGQTLLMLSRQTTLNILTKMETVTVTTLQEITRIVAR